jgi:hypothetical protein
MEDFDAIGFLFGDSFSDVYDFTPSNPIAEIKWDISCPNVTAPQEYVKQVRFLKKYLHLH